uniref:Guanylate cyclase n=1 Tax=Tetraselmis sp. GSL018 TaxID=582737 RepID=A0A061QRL5_9CHLO
MAHPKSTTDAQEDSLHRAVVQQTLKMTRRRTAYEDRQKSSGPRIARLGSDQCTAPRRHFSVAAAGHRASDSLPAMQHPDACPSDEPSSDEALGACCSEMVVGEREPMEGLDALLRFVPWFVRQRCVLGMDMSMLAENRDVSVLFMVGHLQAKNFSKEMIEQLQNLLGSMIDIMEADYGGSTRQVTVDEKGLAAIFVFGLPGPVSNHHSMQCLHAATEVFSSGLLDGADVSFTAGLASGSCFCGIVGSPATRCEYTVMGDTVNTAARLAGEALKRGKHILCSESLYHSIESNAAKAAARELVPVGSVQLKGKSASLPVFVPHDGGPKIHRRCSCCQGLFIVGREDIIAQASDFLRSSSPDDVVMVIEGSCGMGKTAIMKYLDKHIHESVPSSSTAFFFDALKHDKNYIYETMLRSILICDGIDEISSSELSSLEGQTVAHAKPSALPAIIRPYAKQLAYLHRNGHMKGCIGFQNIYRSIIKSRMQHLAMIVLVDNADHLDPLVWKMLLEAVFGEDRRSSHGAKSTATTSKVLMSGRCARHSWSHSANHDSNLQRLMAMQRVRKARLPPMTKDEVAQMASHLLDGSTISEELKAWIEDQSQGIPLQVSELCNWLSDGYTLTVDADGRVDVKKATERDGQQQPPPLRQAIRARIDQLTGVQNVILRCASVLGQAFHSKLLGQILPSTVSASGVNVPAQLELLRAVNLLTSTADENVWKFPTAIHQEVAYSSMLHSTRRDLHTAAAAALAATHDREEDLAEPGEFSMDRRQAEDEIARHRLKALSAASLRQAEAGAAFAETIRPASDAVGRVVQRLIKQEEYTEALDLQMELYEIVIASDVPMTPANVAVKLDIVKSTASVLSRVHDIRRSDPCVDSHALLEREKRILALSNNLANHLIHLQDAPVLIRT